MTGYGTYAAPWIAVQYSKAHTAVLGHRNKFQRQYLQLVQYPWHTVGNHAKVLGTHKHVGSIYKQRQFLHRLLVPELVVAAVEVVIV